MFTGLDLIVVLVVIGLLVYATSPPSEKSGFSMPEPLTVLVVLVVVAMIIVSIT